MATSLDGLIHHLVDQIALCGEHGASPLDFIAHVKSYYVNSVEDSQAQERDHPIPPLRAIASTVDRPFLEQVWKWLIKNPDISLGSHAGHKRLTLSEVEHRNATIEQSGQSNQPIIVAQETNLPKTFAPFSGSITPESIQNGDVKQTQQTPETASAKTKDAVVPHESNFSPGIRLYASKNRMWHAVAGHGPDFSKIKSLDFVCLSIIAACGPKGILQHDLIRISGQDKRSLPARTDRLHDDGYVEKKRVSVHLFNPKRLLHTSQCTLKRFVNIPLDQKQQISDSVSAPAETAKRVKKGGQKDRDVEVPGQSTSAVALESVSENAALSEGRTFPSWTADRPINNQIFELVDRAGIKGMSMNEIRDSLMGDHIKKPLDEYVSRLVKSWQISQPLHIRHLSIVRDTILKGKTQIYMYYTYENFKKLVDGGTGFWEAVTTIPNEVTKGKNIAASLDAKPDVDEYGFPRLEEKQFLGPHNDATLEECVSALRVDPLRVSANDPVLIRKADGSYSVQSKNHQQHSIIFGNGSSPNKAAAMPSQAASINTRTTKSRNEAQSTSSGAVSTKPHVDEPEIVAVSKPRATLAGRQANGPQIQRRKHVRKPDSKPLGRPRKYPKTGIPSNFNTMTPDEVDYLLHSQGMFEKYEIVKIEKEIVRRIEDGENGVTVAHEVLEELDNLRKQQGELPLPITSRAQVLHKFAGEAMPEVKLDEAKAKGRKWKDTRYRPSMAAHTYFVPTLPKQALAEPKINVSEGGNPVLPSRTRKRGQSVSDLESKIYLPSVAAHSWPYVRPPSSAMEISPADALQKNTKRNKGRPPKPKQLPGRHLDYTPSSTAHSGSHLPLGSLSVVKAGRKRKRSVNVPLENDEEHTLPFQYQYLPSISAHSGSLLPPDRLHVDRAGQKRKRSAYTPSPHDEHQSTPTTSSTPTQKAYHIPAKEALTEISNMQLDAGNQGMYPGWEKFMLKYYHQQLAKITRSSPGVFIGETNPRRKRPCEPRDFRPTCFKLAVFKSPRLSEFDWFVKMTIASEQISRPGSRAQTPTLRIVEPASLPITQPMSEGQPDLSRPTVLPPLDSSTLDSHLMSTYMSSYTDISREKTKRTTSFQHTRDAAPFDPFSASLCNAKSSPTTESSNPICKTSILSKTAALSPVINQIYANTNVDDEARAHTPERQADTNGLSELTPNAPVLDDSNPTQRKAAPNPNMQNSQSPTQKISKPSNKQLITNLSRRGGSTAVLRKNIIMEIVEKCEGVFPSHKEMGSPFAAEWKRRGQEGTPEAKTISNAVNALVKERKLRQITFTSQTRQGIAVTKSMLLLPTIDITDPKVKETQTSMVAYHPRYFIPVAVLPLQDYQGTNSRENRINNEETSDNTTEEKLQESSELEATVSRRLHLARRVMDGKEKAAMARLKALKEKDQQELGHADGDEPPTEPLHHLAPTNAANAAPGTGRELLPKATPKHSGGRRNRKCVKRLASINKRAPPQMTPLPAMPVRPLNNPVQLTWLPSDYAFSDFNFEEYRPTVLMAAAKSISQIDKPEDPKPLNFSDKARQRIREIAKNAARIEDKQMLAKSTRPSLLHTDLSSGQLEFPYAPIHPPSSPRQPPTFRINTSSTTRPRNKAFPYTRPRVGEAILDRTVRPVDHLVLENIGPEEMRRLPSTSKTVRRRSVSTTASLSPELALAGASGCPEYSHGDFSTLYQRVLLVSFMDPVHYFHRATGTFSVTFFGIQSPRKIFAHRGTALDPYSANLRPVKPYVSYQRSTLPSSLQESQRSKKKAFDEDVDSLLRRELEVNELDSATLEDWPFVNHVFPHAHQTVQVVEADMEAAKQVTVRLKDGRLTSRAFPRNNNSRLRIGNSIFSTGSRGIDPAVAESRTPLKRRRLTSVVEIGTQAESSKRVDLDHETRPAKLRRVRGPREARSLGENGEERLLTAVMVIRALTGGLDERIDWVLVAKVFEPTYTQMFVHSRWSLTLQKYKVVLPKMESDFKSIFAKAYEEGTVPTLDYDNLEKYDWKWLVEWTMANVDTPTQSLPELPVERSEFDCLYALNEASDNEINEFYEIDGTSALARRTKIVHRDPYVLPLFEESHRARLAEDAEDLSTVRSWIRANIVTPESTYNPSAARNKLSTFPDHTVEDALKQLLFDRVLTQENKGRLIPGRNYDVSEFLVSRLKKNLQSAHFHQAATYKQQLDQNFEKKGFAHFSYAADDGDMIVIVNLLAHQRITIVPIGVPMNKWGQTDGSYETRQMDKRRLNFSLELRPSPTYVYGNPLTPLPAPPSQHLQDPMAKIPLWYDINDSLVPVMWEMALTAIVAVLAMRPGIGASELEKVMRPAMEIWELQEVLEWLVNAKAAKKVGSGFSVEDEWWWLALGPGENSGEFPGGGDSGDKEGRREVKGKGKENESRGGCPR